MNMKSIIQNIKSYLKELITIGVLIAMLISNFKEQHQAKKYYQTSVEAINNEVESNHDGLKTVVERHNSILDTINKYSTDTSTISEIIYKAGGLPNASLRHSGLELYKKNQINLIDFELMSALIDIQSSSETIDLKINKLMDFLYPNLFSNSKENKQLMALHLGNLLESDIELLNYYKDFIEVYGDKPLE